MLDTRARERAETFFDGNQKREKEIDDALKQEAARHAAAVANMRRLRELYGFPEARGSFAGARVQTFLAYRGQRAKPR